MSCHNWVLLYSTVNYKVISMVRVMVMVNRYAVDMHVPAELFKTSLKIVKPGFLPQILSAPCCSWCTLTLDDVRGRPG